MRTKLIAAVCAVCFAASAVMPWGAVYAEKQRSGRQAENNTAEVSGIFDVTIDGEKRNTAENSLWRGFGYISANNSSRLLLDYKDENPDAYWRLLSWLFNPEGGIAMSHIKIEMGADINSSSGTEPATKRTLEEKADVTRGAGFQLAADAKLINPDITLELLSWGAPSFVRTEVDNAEKQRNRYEWFRQTLDSAYEVYGLEFDYISPNYNEKSVDVGWIKYFSDALKSEQDTPYPYKDIKIVAADEDVKYALAEQMLSDKELMAAVDVIGIHYTSTSDENTLRCRDEFGKELWYSEGISPSVQSQYAVNADGSGISGVNSLLDVADRIINMYPNGGFTMYEFQPAVAAYYSGAKYYPKQLVTANEPWSGMLEAGSGVYLCNHFSLFAKKGWQFVEGACFGDGVEDEHVIYDTTNNYMTLSDPETDDYSVILANNTGVERTYNFTVKNLKKADSPVQVWETRGSDGDETGDFGENYLKNIMAVEPDKVGDGSYSYRITVKPYSLVTVSTLEVSPEGYEYDSAEFSRLELPYIDDFEYAEYDADYLSSRGYAPRYTTDQGGAFEVYEDESDGRVLRQVITKETRGVEWGMSPEPVTTLGDDTWANYTVSARVRLDTAGDENNYAGVGLRYINSSSAKALSGYRIVITQGGRWQLCYINDVLAEGEIEDFSAADWHELSITAVGDNLSATVDGVQVAAVTLDGAVTFSGRAALYSAYYQNCFDDLNVLPCEATGYVVRRDNLDSGVSYYGEWEHNIMDSYTCHNRTSSTSQDNGEFSFSFEGDSLALIGSTDNAVISVVIDGTLVADRVDTAGAGNKQCFWHKYSLGYSEHDVKVTVHSGRVSFDAYEFGNNAPNKDGSGERQPEKNDSSGNASLISLEERKVMEIGGASAIVIISAVVLSRKKKRKKN